MPDAFSDGMNTVLRARSAQFGMRLDRGPRKVI